MLYEVITGSLYHFDGYGIDTVIFIAAVVPLDVLCKRLLVPEAVDGFGHDGDTADFAGFECKTEGTKCIAARIFVKQCGCPALSAVGGDKNVLDAVTVIKRYAANHDT